MITVWETKFLEHTPENRCPLILYKIPLAQANFLLAQLKMYSYWRASEHKFPSLWLHGLYRLYGPHCPLSPEGPLNLFTHSLTHSLSSLVYVMACYTKLSNLLWPSDAIWRHIDLRSTLPYVRAWCLRVPSHYLNQCWLIIIGVL